jgi:hypothetical protein
MNGPALSTVFEIKAVRRLLLFNCGNLNAVTGRGVGTARELSSISDWGKGL